MIPPLPPCSALFPRVPAHRGSLRRRGSAVIAVILVLVIVQFAVIGVVLASSRDQDASLNRLSAAQSLYAAEGVANMALREIGLNSDEDGDGGIGSISASAAHADPTIGGATAHAVVTPGSDGASTVQIIGAANAAHRTIQLNILRGEAALGVVPGLSAEMWVSATAITQLSDIPWASTPTAVALVRNVDMPTLANLARWTGGPTSKYAIRLKGTVNIPAAGNWTFTTTSDDGSALYINDALVVNNDNVHTVASASGVISLPEGQASFEVRYFENSGSASVLQASWSGPGVPATTVIPANAFTCDPVYILPAIAADGDIALTGDNKRTTVYVDAFDSTRGRYGGSNVYSDRATVSTNSTSSGAFALTKRAKLKGNALVGPGGSVNGVISISSDASITGSSSANPVKYAALLTALPTGLPASSGNVVLSTTQSIGTSTTRYNNLTIQGNGKNITISGAVVWVIDGDFLMKDRSKIKLNPGATLTIFCAGEMTFQSNAQANTTSGIPSCLSIYMLGRNKDLSVDSKAQLCAAVSNPFGGLSLKGSKISRFYGRFVGTTVEVSSRSRIHADVPTILPSGGAPIMSTQIQGWTYVP